MPLYLLDGKLLLTPEGRLAVSEDCCCGGPPPQCNDCASAPTGMPDSVEVTLANFRGFCATYNGTFVLPKSEAVYPGMCHYFLFALSGGGTLQLHTLQLDTSLHFKDQTPPPFVNAHYTFWTSTHGFAIQADAPTTPTPYATRHIPDCSEFDYEFDIAVVDGDPPGPRLLCPEPVFPQPAESVRIRSL